jgi:glutathione S-transferase
MTPQLHYYPGNASMAVHVLLREIGRPFELVLVDRDLGAHKSAQYLRLNPNGQIPVYVDEGLVLYEAAAICLHLADRAPGAALVPEIGTAARAHCYKWLMWLTNTLQPALMVYFYPERWVAEGNTLAAEELKAHALTKACVLLEQLDAELARHGGPWLLGDNYSVVDPFCMMLCRWSRGFARGAARDRAQLGPYLQRMLQRPAVRAVFAAENLEPPWV